MKMRASEIGRELELRCISEPREDLVVSGGYVGDLLSWVMSRAGAGSAWITIMSNANVAAVALLAEVSMVILAEGVQPDEDLLKKSRAQGIGLYCAQAGAYELSWRLYELLS